MTGHQPTMKEVDDLYRAEAPRLFRRAQFLAKGNRSAAEGLVQDVFEAVVVKYWDTISVLGNEDRRRWLFKVLTNKFIDKCRKEKKILLVSDSELISQAIDDDPAALVLSSISAEQILKAIECMSHAQHRVACLEWGLGWTTREISDALGITESTVRVHRRNAVKALRSLVVPLIYDDADEADDRERGRERRTV